MHFQSKEHGQDCDAQKKHPRSIFMHEVWHRVDQSTLFLTYFGIPYRAPSASATFTGQRAYLRLLCGFMSPCTHKFPAIARQLMTKKITRGARTPDVIIPPC